MAGSRVHVMVVHVMAGTSGKSIAKDQRTSHFLGNSVGLCKAVSMECVVGRMAAKSTEQFEAMGGVVSWIDRSRVYTL